MRSTQLQGTWLATVGAHTDDAVLQLGPHPEWQGNVKGTVTRAGIAHAMVGDVHDGAVTLEESANGTNISGTWLGDMVDDSCGREIRGQFLEGDERSAQPFILRKQSR